jgi:hypothetical protein
MAMAEELAGPAWYSYNLTTETKINIDELIYSLNPMDLPLLTGVGSTGNPVLPRLPVDNTEFYWLEEDAPLPRSTTAASIADGSTTSVTLVSGGAVKFAVGDGIRVEDEVMVITGIDTTTEVLTVARGSAALTNTTAAAHTTVGTQVIGLGTILIEGAIGSANYQGRDRYSNYCQIWSGKVQVSRTAQKMPKYGIPNELNHQMVNRQQHLWTGVEQAALFGVKHKVTATNRRQTGGLDYFIATNEDTGSDWLTISSIQNQQQNAYNRGGMWTHLIGLPNHFEALNNLSGNERVQTVTIEDARRGRQVAKTVMTEFGDVTLCRDRWCKPNEAYGYNPENFIFRQFQPLVTEKLAKSDDTDTYMLVMEGGFEVKGEAHMAKFSALNYSAALPGSGLV